MKVPPPPAAPLADAPLGVAEAPLLVSPSPTSIIPPGSEAELWHGARVGMTLPQVQALFPAGRPPVAYVSIVPPVPNAVSQGSAGWAVDEQVFGRPAVATYYFNGPALLEVVVNVKGLRLRHTRDNVDAARSIEAGMRGYYGRPRLCIDSYWRGLTRLDCRWTARQVQVGLSYTDYGGLGPSLDVAVRAPKPTVHETGEVFSRHGFY